jgi:hypothetical protein
MGKHDGCGYQCHAETPPVRYPSRLHRYSLFDDYSLRRAIPDIRRGAFLPRGVRGQAILA